MHEGINHVQGNKTKLYYESDSLKGGLILTLSMRLIVSAKL